MTFDEYIKTLPASHWAKYDLSAVKLGWDAAVEDTTTDFTKAGWRCCIDHLLKPEHPCPICKIEELRTKLVTARNTLDRIASELGTGKAAHIARMTLLEIE